MNYQERPKGMKSSRPNFFPISGKTYSLFGESGSTAGYYETIRMLADKVLTLIPNIRDLIEAIRKFSLKKRVLKNALVTKELGQNKVYKFGLIV